MNLLIFRRIEKVTNEQASQETCIKSSEFVIENDKNCNFYRNQISFTNNFVVSVDASMADER